MKMPFTIQQGLYDDLTLLTRKNGFIILAVLLSGISVAQDYKKAAASVEADLAAELKNLAALRAEIAAEKPAIARETSAIAAEFREKRRQAELAAQERDALVHDLGALSNRVKIWRDERAYIDSLLGDFRKQYEAHISLGEAASIRDKLLAADADFEAQLALAEKALARISAPERKVQGQALTPKGVAISGEFIEIGPVRWFISEDGKTDGLVSESRGLQPEIVAGTAFPKFDPTLGTAIALDGAKTSLIAHIRQGGFWIYPILLLAVIATLAAIAKWIQLGRIRELRPVVVQRVLAALDAPDSEKAMAELSEISHPARAVLERGIEIHDQPRDDVEEALFEKFLQAQPPLQRGLPLIAIASATAPLLGLLGTVTGMIHTFKLIDIFGTGDAKSLASGISEALVTTEFGLIVAIPALIMHALLSRKVQGIKATMEMTSLAFLNGLKGGGKS